MRKIPTLFKRDLKTGHVTDDLNPDCAWVLLGNGIATAKFDGMACMVDPAGHLWVRREIKPGRIHPEGFVLVEVDLVTQKQFGWIPAKRDNPEHKYFWEAYGIGGQEPGTYELCGPKVQGNPHNFDKHHLIKHGDLVIVGATGIPLNFTMLQIILQNLEYEGLVWRHVDDQTRMAKLKRRDFGLEWPIKQPVSIKVEGKA